MNKPSENKTPVISVNKSELLIKQTENSFSNGSNARTNYVYDFIIF